MTDQVLIVEDEHIAAMEIREMLNDIGYEVTDIVDTASSTFESLEENPADLVLMDIQIPGEMNGIETAKKVKKDYNASIVYLTAYSDDENIQQAKESDPEGYLVKPVTEADLKSTLEIVFKQSSKN